ncbi:DegT/DnrJ/EryC1/StrS family aminotransferase [candidate division WS5 bacterium]|uniref:DegT/DnrJ/EryC1/StrS family aminotransferase n=1 Tax=candidate division WS5 bacterium TaxID=2093353 RepID=A0A419DAW9_9BACT|nr:MAG: DegT/DnrJ/EryC1/StrS family aminotransferase [candidate division WS5 bacterium]
MDRIEKIIDKINQAIVDDEEINAVSDILKSGFLSRPAGGPVVHNFQKFMAEAHDRKYAYASTSGTASLHLAISALELKSGNEVIVPALANIADCSVVIQEGATPVFADIDPEDFNIDPKDVEKKITKNTKAIIVVHMYGQPAKLDQLLKIARDNNLILIEDCAQAGGARYNGKYVGSFGDISCFSFYQTKHIIAGEGGMVLTDNKNWFKTIDSLANNGIMKDDLDAYDYDRIGYNYQITEIQAALGISQLMKLDQNNKVRRENVKLYKLALKDTRMVFQKDSPNTENSYFYLTGLLPENLTKKRKEFLNLVKEQGVPIKTLYPMILPDTKLLKGKVNNDCPMAIDITKRLFNLYVNPGLEASDIQFMAEAIKKAYIKIYNI